jgi:tRNA(fMet)-specific endonuclease VapC
LPLLLDTSVAILLRDGDERIGERLAERPGSSMLSVISRVELENGVYKDPRESAVRRQRLDRMLIGLELRPFGSDEADAYRAIVEACGISRPRTLDRMIAATAIAAGVTLASLNPHDFRDIPRLELEDWSG